MLEQTIEQLRHDDPALRYEAARQLGESSDARAVQPLVNALPDANSKVQYACVSGLIKLGDRRAADAILDLLVREPDSRLWQLLKLNIGLRLRTGLLDMIQPGDLHISDRLTAALQSEMLDEHQRAFFVRLLGRTADTRAVEWLIDRLIEDAPVMQGAAAEALGWIGDARAVAPLMLFLTDDAGTMRELTVEALGRIGDARAVEPLILALEDEDEWVRRAAAEALGRLGDQRAMEPLVSALRDETNLVQDAAFEAIKRLSDDSYQMPL